jgi:hypothetical protein
MIKFDLRYSDLISSLWCFTIGVSLEDYFLAHESAFIMSMFVDPHSQRSLSISRFSLVVSEAQATEFHHYAKPAPPPGAQGKSNRKPDPKPDGDGKLRPYDGWVFIRGMCLRVAIYRTCGIGRTCYVVGDFQSSLFAHVLFFPGTPLERSTISWKRIGKYSLMCLWLG